MTTPYDAIVLAGGAARRLGGADKPGVRVGAGHCSTGCSAPAPGPGSPSWSEGAGPRRGPWCGRGRNRPHGGPLAALDAGLRLTTAPSVLALSADLPFLGEPTVAALLDTLGTGGREGVLCVDESGRAQPLVAVYRAEPLRRELALLATEHGGLGGLPLRLLTRELDLAHLPAPQPLASFDCDTWEDIAAARARIREHGNVLDEWITAVKDELGIDLDVDTGVLLDLARDAAHGVARPAAPLTTFLVGYAAAKAGGEGADVAEAARKAAALANRWAAEKDELNP